MDEPLGKMRRALIQIFGSPLMSEQDFPGLDWDVPRSQEFRTQVTDIKDRGDKLVIDVEIPVVEKKEIELQLTENSIVLSAQRKAGREVEEEGKYLSEMSLSKFRRSMTLPFEVIPEKAEAKFEQGVLHIEVPKMENRTKGKKIEIE